MTGSARSCGEREPGISTAITLIGQADAFRDGLRRKSSWRSGAKRLMSCHTARLSVNDGPHVERTDSQRDECVSRACGDRLGEPDAASGRGHPKAVVVMPLQGCSGRSLVMGT